MTASTDPDLQSQTATNATVDVGAAQRYEDAFRARHPWLWRATLVGPVIVTVALLVMLAMLRGWSWLQKLLATAAATFFFFGRFVILGGHDPELSEIQSFLSRDELFVMLVYMDLALALVLVCHLGALFRLPWIGTRLMGLAEDGRFILGRSPWMKRATFLGTVAFVAFPLAATGSVGGAIFSRLLGMSRRAAFLAISLGSILGCGAMYFGAGLIDRFVDRRSPWLTIGGVAAVALLIVWMNARYRRAKRAAGTPPAVESKPR